MKKILTFTVAMFSLCCNIALASNSQANELTNNSVEVTVPAQLPQELLVKFNNELAKLKAKAEAQKTPKRTEHLMRFYWQYRNAFDAMPVNSQIDVLNIFATGDAQGSKLKGIKLIDKAVEYMVLIDGGFTEENVSKLRKYHNFLIKFNPTVDSVLNSIVSIREEDIQKERTEIRRNIEDNQKERTEIRKRITESAARLEKLKALRKKMEIFAK